METYQPFVKDADHQAINKLKSLTGSVHLKPTHKSMGIHDPPEGPALKVNQVIEESRKNQPVPSPFPPKEILKVGEGPKPPAHAQDLDNETQRKLALK